MTSTTSSETDMVGCAYGTNVIRLRSGHYLDLKSPSADQFVFSDIAGGLSKLCRFGGQSKFFYSIAEHSVICAEQALLDGLPLHAQQALLMHDAAEAFCGDVIRPLKKMLADYKPIETRLMVLIGEKFDINFLYWADAIHEIDNAVVLAERQWLFSQDNTPWHGEETVRKIGVPVNGWEPALAEKTFTEYAQELGIV